MCGIIAMVASRDVVPFLSDALKRMEYRGYDSAGIAIQQQQNGQLTLIRRRAKGKIAALKAAILDAPLAGNTGIGHIRWATHGEASEANAHPHSSREVVVVHNGIIENWQPLKQALVSEGYHFSSQTDTEVIAHLIQSKLDRGLSALDAFRDSIKCLEGAYAIAVMMTSTPDCVYVARAGSPLLIGEGQDALYAGSDALALASVTDTVRYLAEGDYAVINKDCLTIYDVNDQTVEREQVKTGVRADDASKGQFPHFMLKEIHEQPEVVKTLIDQYIDTENNTVKQMNVGFEAKEIARMAFVSCGTAYHAGFLGRYFIESLAQIGIDIDIASEYRYRDFIQPQHGVFVAVSQSGETADTLAALRRAKSEGQHVLAIVNVSSSSIARESDAVLLIHAGSEIGVASTKAFVAQVVVILCLAVWLGRQRGTLSLTEEQNIVKSIKQLPSQMASVINASTTIETVAKKMASATDVLFLGRGRNYPIALEAALKLKEISYIHAEGYASGEMKHGAIALIDAKMPVVCLCPDDNVTEKSLANMQEVLARKAQVILVASSKICQENAMPQQMVMPDVDPITSPILYVVPMQLLAYFTAVALGRDVDQPRNLAKSVTVE